MPGKKEACYFEAIGDVRRRWLFFILTGEKTRQTHQFVLPGLARRVGYRPPRLRRYISEIRGDTRGRALRQVETEAEFGKQHELEAHHQRPGAPGIVEIIQD